MSEPTEAQVDAVYRVLSDAFGPALAMTALGPQTFQFWAPRIVKAVLEAKS